MRNFIEDYLTSPSQVVADARRELIGKPWYDMIDEEQIYKDISSPEFRLYEEITTTPLSASPSHSPMSASA